MRKNLFFGLVLLSMLAALSVTSTPSLAADYTRLGVRVGDNAVYRFQETGQPMLKVVIDVKSTSGTIVTVNSTVYNPDGSINSTAEITHDASQGPEDQGFYLLLICANLTVHDPIFIGASITINETVTMTIEGATRTVNHVNLTSPAGGFSNIWWDKLTGLMVKFSLHQLEHNRCWRNMTLTGTSLWRADEWSALTLVLGFSAVSAVAIIAAVVLVHLRRKK